MSAQSIINISDCGVLSNTIDSTLIKLANVLLNYNDFNVGCKPNINDYLELKRLKRIVCDSCLHTNYLKELKNRIITLNLKYK